jgi:hypothetical protein
LTISIGDQRTKRKSLLSRADRSSPASDSGHASKNLQRISTYDFVWRAEVDIGGEDGDPETQA